VRIICLMKYQTAPDQPLTIEQGVAAVDIITLRAAAEAIEPYVPSREIVLPSVAKGQTVDFFKDLTKIMIDPIGRKVTAHIDTKKMSWDPALEPRKTTFVSYEGKERQSATFLKAGVLQAKDTQVAILPARLFDGREALVWATELSAEQLRSMTTYGLFGYAGEVVASYDPTHIEQYNTVQLPTQDIQYTRSMSEMMELNPELADAIQEVTLTLDDRGVRFTATTMLLAGRAPSHPKKLLLGTRGPVMFWMTEISVTEATVPFAVIVSTDEAWSNVNDDDKEEKWGGHADNVWTRSDAYKKLLEAKDAEEKKQAFKDWVAVMTPEERKWIGDLINNNHKDA